MKFSFVERWNDMMLAWLEDPISVRPASIVNKFSPESFFKKIPLIIKDVVADVFRLFKKQKIPKNKVWFLVLTQNNLNALEDIQESVSDSIFVSYFRFRSTIKNKNTYYFTLPFRFFWDLVYPIYWLIYLKFNPIKAKRYFELLITVNGTYEECVRLLNFCKPKAIVFSNDHLIEARALLLAANDLKIDTYYVQHAAVGDYFPPLKFKYSFLEGEDSLVKYTNCGDTNSKIYLTGMPKFDKYSKQVNEKKQIQSVGIAFNAIDTIESIHQFSITIKKNHPELNIILRPHPGDDRNMDILKIFQFSDSRSENSFEFLSKIDCLIAGESSIHLEATLMNVYPMHYSFVEPKLYDIYGFLRNDFVEHFNGIEEVNQKLNSLKKEKPFVQQKAKYYNEAIGSDFYGASVKKISTIISENIN